MNIVKVGMHAAENVGFSRLKGIFRKGINYTQYDKIVDTAKNKIVGNLPKDLLNSIIVKHPNEKAKCIKAAQGAFENAAAVLSDTEKIQIQSINRTPSTLENTVKLIESSERKDIYQDKIFKQKSAQIIKDAQTEIYNGLKKIFPEIGEVKISNIGDGCYSNAFKCHITDKNGKKICEDTVIKSFKSVLAKEETASLKFDSMLAKYSDEEILQYAKEHGIKITQTGLEATRSMSSQITDWISKNKGAKTYMNSMHGAKPEANAAQYLKTFGGHKIGSKEGLSIPDMFYLGEHPFSLAKFVDGSQTAERKFNFKRLGLTHTDLELNPANAVNGVCIDLGGIRGALNKNSFSIFGPSTIVDATKSDIVGNKQATRILKHIQGMKSFEQADEYIKALEYYADHCKSGLERKTILSTLKEIKEKKLNPNSKPKISLGKLIGNIFQPNKEAAQAIRDVFADAQVIEIV